MPKDGAHGMSVRDASINQADINVIIYITALKSSIDY